MKGGLSFAFGAPVEQAAEASAAEPSGTWRGFGQRATKVRIGSTLVRLEGALMTVEHPPPRFAYEKLQPVRASLILPEVIEEAAMAFTEDPHAEWIRAHHAELAEYVGHFVAIDPDRGIVDAGDDPVALAERNRPWDNLMVHFVGPGFYAPTEP